MHGVDYIAASFVRKPEDIDTIRMVLGEEGAHIKVLSAQEEKEEEEKGQEEEEFFLSTCPLRLCLLACLAMRRATIL